MMRARTIELVAEEEYILYGYARSYFIHFSHRTTTRSPRSTAQCYATLGLELLCGWQSVWEGVVGRCSKLNWIPTRALCGDVSKIHTSVIKYQFHWVVAYLLFAQECETFPLRMRVEHWPSQLSLPTFCSSGQFLRG